MGYAGRVAIITRTKDRPLLLERAIRSVLDQTYSDWFMMIVNDGGDPAPVNALVERYRADFAGRVAVLHNSTSVGMEAASNLGIEQTKSEYLVIHDDDDSWAPTFLQMCLDELEQIATTLPSVKGVISYTTQVMEHIDGNKVVVDSMELFNTWIGHGLVSVYRMAQSNMYPPISFLYRREALEVVGPYRADLPVLGDWEYNLRFIARFDICIVPSTLAFYHHRPASATQLGNTITAGRALHVRYDAYLRNEFLRADLHGEGNGLGVLMNTGRELLTLSDRLTAENASDGQSKTMLARKFVKHLRAGGPAHAFKVMSRYTTQERSVREGK